jgi:hypothetical protein
LAVKVSVAAGAEPGSKLITLEVSNVSKSSALWIDWQLKAKSGSQERFLGVGNITNLNGAEKHTLTVEYVPSGEPVTIEASVTPDQSEVSAAARANNVKAVSIAASALPSTLQVAELNPTSAATAGATHHYTPRSGMTGCSMTQAPQGTNALGVNISCTAPGAGEIELFKNFTLKQNWKVNGVAVGTLGGGTLKHRQLPLAGSAAPHIRLDVTGAPNQSPVVVVRVDLVGPANTSPY